MALGGFVFGSAFRGFDADGLEAPTGEVVWAGAHVDFAEFHGAFEAVEEEFGADPWHAFRGPFVEVHVGVDAAGLFVEFAGFEGRLEAVERASLRGEEAEGIVVGAADGSGFDQVIDGGLGEAERGGFGMADVVALIDHGPFVESVAGEVAGSAAGCYEEIADPAEAEDFLLGEKIWIGEDPTIKEAVVAWCEGWA
jgi:hypothetical protein